jgi:hypothetical protein
VVKELLQPDSFSHSEFMVPTKAVMKSFVSISEKGWFTAVP